MGCDIHLHIEIKIGGQWHHYSAPSIKRHYALFAHMANVRNSPDWQIEPIKKPNGIPGDATRITLLSHTRDNYHHETWIDSNEITQLYKAWDQYTKRSENSHLQIDPDLDNVFGYLEGNSILSKAEDWIDDIRFIFWFDN